MATMSTLCTMASSAFISPNSNTLLMISLSSCSRTPSSWPTLTIIFRSSSVIRDFGSSSFILNILNIMVVTIFIINTNGARTIITTLSILAKARDILSLLLAASVFGVTSPKTNTNTVMTSVAIAIP